MARGESPYQGRYTVPQVDFSPIERGGAAWGRAFEQVGGAIGKGIEQKAQLKDAKKIALSQLKLAENLMPTVMTKLPKEAQDTLMNMLKSAREVADDPELNLRQQVAELQGLTQPIMPWVHAISSMPKDQGADFLREVIGKAQAEQAFKANMEADQWMAELYGPSNAPTVAPAALPPPPTPFYGGQPGGQGTLPSHLAAKLAAVQQGQPTVPTPTLPPPLTPQPQQNLPPIPSGAAPPRLAPQIPEPQIPSVTGQNIPAPMQGPPQMTPDVLPPIPGGPVEPPVDPATVLPPSPRRNITEELRGESQALDAERETKERRRALLEDLRGSSMPMQDLRESEKRGLITSSDAEWIINELKSEETMLDIFPMPEPPKGEEGPKGKGPKGEGIKGIFEQPKTKAAPGQPYPNKKYPNIVYDQFDPDTKKWSVKPAEGYYFDKSAGPYVTKKIPKEKLDYERFGIPRLAFLEDLGAEDSNALLNLYEMGDKAETDQEREEAESHFTRLAQDLVARGEADSFDQVLDVVGKEYEAKQEEDAVEGLKEMGIELEEDPKGLEGPPGPTGATPSNKDIKKWTRARVEQELNIKAPPKPEPLNPIETLIWEAREKYGGLVEDSSTKSTFDRIDERLKNIRSYPEEVLDYNIKLTQMAKSLFELQDLQKAPTKPEDLLTEVNKLHGLSKASGLEMNMTYREGKLTIGFPTLGTKGQDLVPTWYDHIDPKTKKVTRKLLEFDGKVVMRDIRTNKYLYVDTENKILSAAGPTPSYVLTQLNQSEEKLYQILAAKVHLVDNDKKDINTHTFLDILQRPDGWFKNPRIREFLKGDKMVGDVDDEGWSVGQGKWELKITPPKSAGKGALPYNLNIQVYEWDKNAKAVKTEEFTDTAGHKTSRPVMNPQFETAMEKALEAAKHFDMFTNILPTMLRQNLGFPAHDSTGGQRQIKDREAIESGLDLLFK